MTDLGFGLKLHVRSASSFTFWWETIYRDSAGGLAGSLTKRLSGFAMTLTSLSVLLKVLRGMVDTAFSPSTAKALAVSFLSCFSPERSPWLREWTLRSSLVLRLRRIVRFSSAFPRLASVAAGSLKLGTRG
jgi:hypothetical protein